MSEESSQAVMLKAAKWAVEAHQGQERKGSSVPYAVHPLRVAEKVSLVTLPAYVNRERLILAALLHDTLEDTNVTEAQIQESFGPDVANIVRELTQDKTLPKPERRRQMLDHCKTMSRAAQIIKLADRLDNMKEMNSLDKDFIERYCTEATVMIENMKGACPELEEEIRQIIDQPREQCGQSKSTQASRIRTTQ